MNNEEIMKMCIDMALEQMKESGETAFHVSHVHFAMSVTLAALQIKDRLKQ